VYRRIRANGEVQVLETITPREVDPLRNPGVWFPVAVHSQVGAPGRPTLETPILKCQFADVVINDSRGFANALTIQFTEGTEVRDRATGQVYVVGKEPLALLANPGVADVNDTPAQPEPDVAAWRTAFEAVYRLEDGQVLKCIREPFAPERATYLQESGFDNAGRNDFYCFVWDDALEAPEHLGQARTLPLATIIERVIGLNSYEYEGLPHVLRLRLEGDWVVRKDAPAEQRLAALEPIVKDQTQWSLGFAEQQVDAIVIRSAGTYRFSPQPEIAGASSVHIYAGNWAAQRDALGAGTDCGTVAALLDHVADRIGMPIINGTRSPDIEVCWATHESSQLYDQKSVSSFYNTQLASLLTNLTHQTGLTFSMELGTVVRWDVSTQRDLTARSN
jgi:hypothetical protein